MIQKKIISILSMLCLSAGLLSGCGKTEGTDEKAADIAESGEDTAENEEDAKVQQDGQAQTTEKEDGLSGNLPMEFVFSSGAGGWATSLVLEADGTFSGSFYDSEMGVTGEDYPNGTVYIAEFTGTFGDFEKVDEYACSMTLKELTTKEEPGKEWIDEGICYVASDVYGLFGTGGINLEEDGFLFYTPDAPLTEFSEDFMGWYPYRFMTEEEGMQTLSCYGIYNKETGDAFFSQLLSEENLAGGQEEAAEDAPEMLEDGSFRLDSQTFSIATAQGEDITFATYVPDFSKNPYGDVIFAIAKDGEIITILPEMREENTLAAAESFSSVAAVSFPDYNKDGKTDVITLTNYAYIQGPDVGNGYVGVRVYEGADGLKFRLDKELSKKATKMEGEKTVAAVLNLLAENGGSTDSAGNVEEGEGF